MLLTLIFRLFYFFQKTCHYGWNIIIKKLLSTLVFPNTIYFSFLVALKKKAFNRYLNAYNLCIFINLNANFSLINVYRKMFRSTLIILIFLVLYCFVFVQRTVLNWYFGPTFFKYFRFENYMLIKFQTIV